MNDEVSIKPLSPFDQAEKICSELVKQLKDSEFRSLLDKYNEEFTAAEPTTELTDDDLEAIEEAKVADRLQRRCEYARKVLNSAIKIKIADTSSQFYIEARKGLDLLDKIETGDISQWREFRTIFHNVIQLCRAECQKPSVCQRIWNRAKRIPRWICGLVVAVFVAVIAAIVVDIFADFGWLERIKAFFTR